MRLSVSALRKSRRIRALQTASSTRRSSNSSRCCRYASLTFSRCFRTCHTAAHTTHTFLTCHRPLLSFPASVPRAVPQALSVVRRTPALPSQGAPPLRRDRSSARARRGGARARSAERAQLELACSEPAARAPAPRVGRGLLKRHSTRLSRDERTAGVRGPPRHDPTDERVGGTAAPSRDTKPRRMRRSDGRIHFRPTEAFR